MRRGEQRQVRLGVVAGPTRGVNGRSWRRGRSGLRGGGHALGSHGRAGAGAVTGFCWLLLALAWSADETKAGRDFG
jgi:hypothetical protein